MGKNITIEEDVYRLLSSLKKGPGDSFTKVIRRHVHAPAKTNAELLKYYEEQAPPDVDWNVLKRIRAERGGVQKNRNQ